ncbi:glycosyltransferase family 2 protein [Croceivirga sp. JEA036]|uniref:glycosyltransferase family 2 protein n=1 Tax=Croceivirga sp. JEA036 TaxID=2721162 RepID=UPI00143AFF1F|nr:glycosyltransferase family 2 protein [Croceivirga sp. JEA036]NJB37536.1 glycosyltransferase family 2 protein [Croceivirga sp. JEA036]
MSKANQKLTALLITYNEMEHIKQSVASVSFADEIIVVDSFSTDGTFEYLKSLSNVIVLQKEFSNFTDQKAYTLSKASNNWVLFIDADEVVSKPLQNEILTTINSLNTSSAYWFYRKFMFKNHSLNFSGWQTDKNIRLFKKSHCSFTKGRLVHETLQVKGETSALNEKLTHYCYKSYKDYKRKMVQYGSLKASELFLKNKSFNILKLVFKPIWKFVYNYFFRLGILDGYKGFIICYLNALSVYIRYSKLYLLKNELHLSSTTEQEKEYHLKTA